MQESNSIIEFSLFPVPTDMLKALKLDPSDKALKLDPSDTVQYSISRGRLIIEAVDREPVFGPYRRCLLVSSRN